jgi:hypothetical protein
MKTVDEPDADIAYYPEDHEGGEHYLRVSPVIPETVGQHTGLTAAKSCRGDKPEDRRIFEGDVVELNYGGNGKYAGVIEWSEKDCAFMLARKNYGHYSLARVNESPEAAEILGNIHDTPSLLKN